MVRRFHRSIYDELDELRASMDYLYQLAFEPGDTPRPQPGDSPDSNRPPLHTGDADVIVDDDSVLVTVDAVAGSKDSLFVDCIDDTTLRITCDRQEEEQIITPGNIILEQRSISLHRVIALPVPVMKEGIGIHLKHGVLDIRLIRQHPARS